MSETDLSRMAANFKMYSANISKAMAVGTYNISLVLSFDSGTYNHDTGSILYNLLVS